MPAKITLMSQKGGVGKSTLARSLALVCTNADLDVILIDLDDQNRTLTRWVEVRKLRGVSPLLTVKAFDDADEALGYIDEGSWDVAIIDMPDHISEDTLKVARASHLIVQPTGPTLDDMLPAIDFFHDLEARNISTSHMAIVLCRVLDDEEETNAREYIKGAECEILEGSIPESRVYRKAHNMGRTLMEIDDDAHKKRADQLLNSIILKLASLAKAQKRNIAKGRTA